MTGKKDNAAPLFDWGKYYEKDGQIVMPVSVQAHHSFVDGIHIGKFADKLQTYVDGYVYKTFPDFTRKESLDFYKHPGRSPREYRRKYEQ